MMSHGKPVDNADVGELTGSPEVTGNQVSMAVSAVGGDGTQVIDIVFRLVGEHKIEIEIKFMF